MKRTLMSCAVASLLVSGSALLHGQKNQSKSLSLGRGRKYRYGCTPGGRRAAKRVESECQRGEVAREVLGWLAMMPLRKLKRMAIPWELRR